MFSSSNNSVAPLRVLAEPAHRFRYHATSLARLCTAPLLMAVASLPVFAQSAPKSGEEVLQLMHDAYAGKWYRTLIFTQRTTQRRKDGTDTVSTWYESLRQLDTPSTQLRIDFGDPAAGNGVLYTADSVWVIRNGKVTATRDHGNEFLPLIEGVYMQPVSKTMEQLRQSEVDMSRVTTAQWKGRAAWVVGVTAVADSTTPQFWIDTDRKVVVRMILSPSKPLPSMDIHLDDYVKVGGGWLATKIVMLIDGTRQQSEEYSKWKVDVPLDDALFQPTTWTSAAHWAGR